MALSATSMKSRIEAYMTSAGAVQTTDPTAAAGHRDSMLLALCNGIIDEIKANAVVTTGDAQGGVNTGTVA